MFVSKNLNFNVLGLYKELFNENVLVAESLFSFILNKLKLTAAQKRAIWNSYGYKTESPWG